MTPWRVETFAGNFFVFSGVVAVAMCTKKEDADRIVTAVNSHADLERRLAVCRDALERIVKKTAKRDVQDMTQIEAAIEGIARDALAVTEPKGDES